MPTDAQDTHIMKAHLRKHEVFHNIASAPENVAFNNSLGDRKHGSQHLVGTSFRRPERTGKGKIEKGFPFTLLGDAKSSSSNGGTLSATRGKSREKHAPSSPAAPTLNTWGDSSGKPRRAMKRHSTKTDLTTDQCSGKEGNAPPKSAPNGWKNLSLIIERFGRLWKTLKTWNSFENRCGKISKRAVSDRSKP